MESRASNQLKSEVLARLAFFGHKLELGFRHRILQQARYVLPGPRSPAPSLKSQPHFLAPLLTLTSQPHFPAPLLSRMPIAASRKMSESFLPQHGENILHEHVT